MGSVIKSVSFMLHEYISDETADHFPLVDKPCCGVDGVGVIRVTTHYVYSHTPALCVLGGSLCPGRGSSSGKSCRFRAALKYTQPSLPLGRSEAPLQRQEEEYLPDLFAVVGSQSLTDKGRGRAVV